MPIVEGAGRADMTRPTPATPEVNPRELAIKATIENYNIFIDQLIAFVRENVGFLSEDRITSVPSIEDMTLNINGAMADVHWYQYDFAEEHNVSNRVHFPVAFLWDQKAFCTAKGHYELRKIAKIQRDKDAQNAKDLILFEQLKAKFGQ